MVAQQLWHKIWLVNQLAAPIELPKDTSDAILGFTDILPDFRLAQKIGKVAPIVEALAEHDLGVDDLLEADATGYYQYWEDSDVDDDDDDDEDDDDDDDYDDDE